MKPSLIYAICIISVSLLQTSTSNADVVLTFDQSGIANSALIDQDYGDQVVAPSDSVGTYNIIAGGGFGFTPNVEVSYTALSPRLWIDNYGDLQNVLYDEVDGSNSLQIDFTADAGFEVGLFGFDMAAFGFTDITIPGVSIIDGNSNVLWSATSSEISSSTRNSFNTGGVFAEQLTIAIDLTGLGGESDNIGIDNIHFAQRLSAVPEPSGISLILFGVIGLVSYRRR